MSGGYLWSDVVGRHHVVYEPKGGGTATLLEAWEHLRGVACCAILQEQADGSLLVIAKRGTGSWQHRSGQYLRSWRPGPFGRRIVRERAA